ncbi:MAG TPA: transketolase C-terminal domain-containing protein [Nitrososphaerales archaeon]|nr:transketolase C-terminal domain-containing protein [Nitrososphaerales archaeon]HUK75469.1 transketolase C-terminal domain-containing protein [Nitrososphaerales archaeon]
MLEKMGAMRTAYGEALVELGATNPRAVVVGADTTESLKSGMFGAKYPDRFFNLGIAEQNLVGVAAGLAFGGKVAFAGTYAIFVPGKCVDQIRNMLCYADLDVKLVCSHAGITVGPDGGSHEQVEDLALMRCVPHMRVVVPADAPAVKGIVKAIADIPGPFYVRITRGVVKGSNTPIVYENGFDYKLGKANVVMDGGGDVALFACGIMVPEAMRAAESLKAKGVKASVIDVHTVKPIDVETILKYAKSCGAAVSAEEHNIMGGMGSAVSEVLTENYPIPLKRVGVMDTFGESGEAQELLNKYGLTAAHIEEAARKAIAMKR